MGPSRILGQVDNGAAPASQRWQGVVHDGEPALARCDGVIEVVGRVQYGATESVIDLFSDFGATNIFPIF